MWKSIRLSLLYISIAVAMGGANCPGTIGQPVLVQYACEISAPPVCFQYTKELQSGKATAEIEDDHALSYFETEKTACDSQSGEWARKSCSSESVAGKCTGSAVPVKYEPWENSSEASVIFYRTPSANEISQFCPQGDFVTP